MKFESDREVLTISSIWLRGRRTPELEFSSRTFLRDGKLIQENCLPETIDCCPRPAMEAKGLATL